MAEYTWEQRIERAEHLAQSIPHVRDVLSFYAELLKWQRDLFNLMTAVSLNQALTGHFEADHPILLNGFDSLLKLIDQQGSRLLIAQAGELALVRDEWKPLLTGYWNGVFDPQQGFFARACLQPYLEHLAETQTLPADSELKQSAAGDSAESVVTQPRRLCRFCGRKPQLAVLSNQTTIGDYSGGGVEGGRRFLMCGDCQTRWDFQRIACANCLEEDPDKLSYYCADDRPEIRVECCETCRHFIKSIDLTKNNLCVPIVDELAAIPLDLWAREQGYRKIQPNLAGM